jgi:hypothetical protein
MPGRETSRSCPQGEEVENSRPPRGVLPGVSRMGRLGEERAPPGSPAATVRATVRGPQARRSGENEKTQKAVAPRVSSRNTLGYVCTNIVCSAYFPFASSS